MATAPPLVTPFQPSRRRAWDRRTAQQDGPGYPL